MADIRVLEIAPATLAYLLERRSTLALIDVREHGEYNTAHIPGSSGLPRRLIEERMPALVPSGSVQVVVCDDDGRRARLAARTLAAMGYLRVAVLDGGTNRWFSEGYPVEWGINVPSKDFGERVEIEHHVPEIDSAEMARRLQAGERMVILDTRTPEEYRRFTIPGSRSVPTAELALRITDIAKGDPKATVLVHCAGRTRSIIGTRTLQRMGLPNVVGLKNGTSGWVMAGFDLEFGATRTALPEPSKAATAAAESYAERIAREDGVRFLSIPELQDVMSRHEQDCVYLIDVRPADEFAKGHIPGFRWYPGGQAVQEAELAVAVRQAPVVFCCDGISRAAVIASWYRQMGFPNVSAVKGGTAAWLQAGSNLEKGSGPKPFGLEAAAGEVDTVSARALAKELKGRKPPTVVFVDRSREFADGHVPGARWLPRGWLELRARETIKGKKDPVVVTDANGTQALLAAAALQALGYGKVRALAGGMAAWRRAKLAVEQGLAGVMSPPEDVLPAIPHRSTANMMNYLSWEVALGKKYRRTAPEDLEA